MTYSTLASIVKYPYASVLAGGKQKFGFFMSEQKEFGKIAAELGIKRLSAEGEAARYARHPLVYLVEAADDICYQMMDIEDAYRLKILDTEQTKRLYRGFMDPERARRTEEVCRMVADENEQIAYLRSVAIGVMVNECTRVFVENEESILNGTFRGTLVGRMDERAKRAYEDCSEVAYSRIYRSKEVVDVELAGYRVMSTLTDLMIEAVMNPEKAYSRLLINRVSAQYDVAAPTLYGRIMAVLDYISGMTDVYALDLYRKINGNSLPAV